MSIHPWNPRTSGPRGLGVLSIAAVMVLLISASSSVASRPPTEKERRPIVRTVKSSALTAGVSDKRYTVRYIRISTVSTPGRTYGRLRLVPRPGSGYDGALGIVRRLRGHWRLIDLGTAGAGCKTLPRAVRVDLEVECP
jgi:hypothetical protein